MTHLLAALSVAVPMAIENLREQPAAALEALRVSLTRDIQLNADSMQFGDSTAGAAASGFVAQARALALLALQAEGGVDFCGLHWCAVPYCPAASRFDHATEDGPATESDPEPVDEPTRPVSDVPVGAYL